MTATGDSGWAVGNRAMGLRRLTVLGVLTRLCVLIGGIGAGNARASSGAATTWKAQDASSAGKSGGLLSVTFTDAAHGWAVGDATASAGIGGPVILATSDGGATWKAQDASSAGKRGRLFSVTSTDATHGWAVGYAKGSAPLVAPVILAANIPAAAIAPSSKGGSGMWLVVAVIVGLALIVALGAAVAIRWRRVTGVAAAVAPVVPNAHGPIDDTVQPGAAQGSLAPC